MSDYKGVGLTDDTVLPEQEAICILSRRERRRIETRDRLFEAATRLLSERDFDSVTVEMITEAADVGKGTFFNYFANKEGIVAYYFEYISQFIGKTFQDQMELLTQLQQNAASPEEIREAWDEICWKCLMDMVRQIAEFDSRSRRFARTLLALCQTNETVRKESLRVKEQMLESAVELMRLEQSLGLVRSDYSPDVIARFLRNVYFSTLTEWAQRDDDMNLVESLDINFVLARSAIRPHTTEERG
ncbi:TetR family transcriptional regulator [Armatimonadota bacterium]|nr:TetR family transcriptional regulator [Armatimonadota bacterium]